MRTQTYIQILVIMALPVCSAAVAQQRTSGNIARIVFQQDANDSTASSEGLQGALNSLRDETRKLQSSTKQTPSAETVARPAPFLSERPSRAPELGSLRPTMEEDAAIEGIGNTEDIVERIELLKRIYEKKRLENEKQAKQTTLKAQSPLQNSQQQTNEIPDRSISDVADAVKQEDPGTQVLADANSTSQIPVNMFEMGNSLYQTGAIQTALDAYVQVDRAEMTASEHVWLDFMIASCQRRLENWDEAIVLYREVANQQEVPNLTKPAQRWLKQLDRLNQAKSTVTQMESEIESLIKTAESYVKQ